MVGDHDSHQPCRCAQHRTETFGGANDAAHSCVSALEAAEYFVDRHVRFSEPTLGAVTYSGNQGKAENDAATVVELVKRGDSWHISIRAGVMYCENAEPSLGAALDCVARVLGEKLGQFVDSCAEVPTVRRLGPDLYYSSEHVRVLVSKIQELRAELLASLPPCRIDDPEALAKLPPSRVRAYLKSKGWNIRSAPHPMFSRRDHAPGDWQLVTGIVSEALIPDPIVEPARLLNAVAEHERRSAAAVYLDILAAEPEAS